MKLLLVLVAASFVMNTPAQAGFFGKWQPYDQVWWDVRNAEMSD